MKAKLNLNEALKLIALGRAVRTATANTPRPRFNVGDFVVSNTTERAALVVADDESNVLAPLEGVGIKKHSVRWYAHIHGRLQQKYGVRDFVNFTTANAPYNSYRPASAEAIEAARIK